MLNTLKYIVVIRASNIIKAMQNHQYLVWFLYQKHVNQMLTKGPKYN